MAGLLTLPRVVTSFSFAGRRDSLEAEAGRAVADDAAQVRAARAGDRAAFGELYARYSRMVHGLLLARVPPADADDLTQEVFFQAWRELRKLRDDEAFGGWLAQIARNRARDHFRRARPQDELPASLAAPGGVSQEQEARAALLAIRELPEAYRETLLLRLVEGMTGPEIAARTGLTPDSVRVNLHRGMKRLRERLEGGTP
jgi:RNA polymerase sigma-70 factor (ECF subfamily)